jgi:hypothetical protein
MEDATVTNTYTNQFKRELPNAQMVLILGIASLILDVICGCCYGGVFGWVVGLIGWIMGNRAIKEYESNPSAFTPQSYNQAKNGKLMSMIGLILGLVSFFGWIMYVFFVGFINVFDSLL